MTDYTELVKALRCCIPYPPEKCVGCTYNIGNNECAVRRMMTDAADAIEALQAEVDALVHDNERYIQFNTDLLNTKEVSKDEMDEILEYLRNAPVGPLEPMRIEQLPKRGQYVHGRELSREYIGDCLVSIDYEDWRCSVCGIVFEQWSMPTYNYCPNCGAKMEVQDDKI